MPPPQIWMLSYASVQSEKLGTQIALKQVIEITQPIENRITLDYISLPLSLWLIIPLATDTNSLHYTLKTFYKHKIP